VGPGSLEQFGARPRARGTHPPDQGSASRVVHSSQPDLADDFECAPFAWLRGGGATFSQRSGLLRRSANRTRRIARSNRHHLGCCFAIAAIPFALQGKRELPAFLVRIRGSESTVSPMMLSRVRQKQAVPEPEGS